MHKKIKTYYFFSRMGLLKNISTLVFLYIFPYLTHSYSLNSSLQISKAEYDSFKSGIIAKDIGKLTIYNSHYIFPLRIYHSEIYGQYAYLHDQFEALYELINPSTPQNLTNSLVEVILEELKDWKSDYGDSISIINNMFKWSLDPPNLRRTKRGYLDGIGSFSKMLFGTAMDSDVNHLNSSMTKLLSRFKTHELQLNIHTKILNVSTARISRIDIVQKKLVRLVNDLADKIEYYDNFSQIIESQIYNSNAFSSLILALMSLNQKTVILKKGIEEMMQGKLSPSIIDTKALRYYLTLIQKEGHNLLINENDILLSFYYNIAQVHSTLESETSSILFLVSFPINFSVTKTFDLKEIISLPVASYYENIFTKYRVEKYLAISSNGKYFERNTLADCKKSQNIYVCPLTTQLNVNHNQSCALRLINNIMPLEPICSTNLVRLSAPTFYLDKGIWYYSTPYPIELKISCNDKYYRAWINVRNETLKGSGKIRIGMGCWAVSKNIYLMPTEMNFYIKGRNYSQKVEHKRSKMFTKKLKSFSKLNKINMSELIGSDQQNLEELTSRMKLLNNFNNDYNSKIEFYTDWSYGTSIISMFALALTIFLLSLFVQEYTREMNRNLEDMEGHEDISTSSIMFLTQKGVFTKEELKEAYRKDPLYENIQNSYKENIRNPSNNQEIVIIHGNIQDNETRVTNNPVYVDMVKDNNKLTTEV